MMALAGVELETLVSEPDALTTRPPHLPGNQALLSCVKGVTLFAAQLAY